MKMNTALLRLHDISQVISNAIYTYEYSIPYDMPNVM